MATKYLSSSVEEQMMISKSIEEKEDRYKEDQQIQQNKIDELEKSLLNLQKEEIKGQVEIIFINEFETQKAVRRDFENTILPNI